MTSAARANDEPSEEAASTVTSADAKRSSVGSSWLRARLASGLDNYIEWRWRAVAAIRGRARARLEVVLPSLEVELAKRALGKNGWQALSVEHLTADEWADRRVLVVGTMPLRSRLLGQNPSRVVRQVKELLAEARVLQLESVAVSTARPADGGLERWVPVPHTRSRRPPSTIHEMTGGPKHAEPIDGIAVIGTEAGARRAWVRLCPGASGQDLTLERARTPGQRLLNRPARTASGGRGAWGVLFGLAILVFALALIYALVAGQSDRVDEGSLLPPWWQVPALRSWLLTLTAASAISGLTRWVDRQRQARERHPGNDADDLRAFDQHARRPMVWDTMMERLSPFSRRAFAVSLLTGSAATGIFMGGMSDLPPLEWSSLLAVPLFAAAYMLWTALSRLHLPALIRAGAALGLVPLLVLGFGQWCLYLYFAGMGVPAAAIDIPRVDALTVALTPLLLAGLLLAFGWAGARWLDGHSRAFAAIVLSMFLLGAIGLVLNSLSSAEQRGRRVAAGLATPAVPGLRLVPGPTPKCLVWASAETGVDHEALPREVWEIGRQGSRTLVLHAEEARRAHPVPAGSSTNSYVPPRNIVAPIRPFTDDQVRLLPKIGGDCHTAYATSS